MSEWFLACLLRLYPREFQRTYGADALQLIRDRSRDERGVLLRVRLCFDLLADVLAMSLRNRSRATPLPVAATACTGRGPALLIRLDRHPRPEALATGALVSIVMFAVFTQMFYPLAFQDMRVRWLIPDLVPGLNQSDEAIEPNRSPVLLHNCLFEKVEMLSPNIGYLKLNGFPDPSVCRSITKAAMESMSHADALIFDLRDNPGGFDSTALQIAGYLFERPAIWDGPGVSPSDIARTVSPVPGSRLTDGPVYVLTSARTGATAEYFAYTMKRLERGTIVGETTAGRQHAGAFRVEPDVTMSGSDTVDAVRKLAASVLRGE